MTSTQNDVCRSAALAVSATAIYLFMKNFIRRFSPPPLTGPPELRWSNGGCQYDTLISHRPVSSKRATNRVNGIRVFGLGLGFRVSMEEIGLFFRYPMQRVWKL